MAAVGGDGAVRAVFVNQGSAGSTMGHMAIEASLRHGLAAGSGIDARFERLPGWSVPWRAFGHPVPLLHWADLDLYDLRGHLVEAVRGRQAIERAVREDRPDVLHVDSHVMALLAGDLVASVPTFLSVDTTIWAWRQLAVGRPVRRHSGWALAASRSCERAVLSRAAGVLSQSNWAAQAVRQTAPGARVTVLHPGIDADRFRPVAKAARRRPRVLFVGGRFREKGGHDLVAALGPYVGSRLDLDVVTPHAEVKVPGVRVHRLSPGSADLVELVQQADLFCLPTYHDALPMSMLEALACGVPAVSTTVAAIPEVLGETGAGRLVPPGDRAALRSAVLDLVDDRASRAAMGERAREVVERQFDARRQGAALARILGEAGRHPAAVAV